MRKLKKVIPVLLIITLIMGALSVNVYAAAKKPGKTKITKTSVSLQKVSVKYKKVRNAKKYRLYKVTSKTRWKYLKTVRSSEKKKYKNAKKYKLKKSGDNYKVYQKKNKKTYKKLAESTKLKMSFTGKWNTEYRLVVRAYNGKKAGKYSDAVTVKIGKRPSPDYDKYETYVFFGSDSRANDESWKSQNGGKITTDTTSHGHSVPFSDVIMLFNVNRDNSSIDVVSVYRDTALNLSENEETFRKINQAYSEKGPVEACKVLERNLDIKIKGYAVSNFKGVADVIDSLAKMSNQKGIKISKEELTIPTYGSQKELYKDVIDVANNYLKEMNRIYGRNVPYIEHPAEDTDVQYLNGLQAVAFSRVRYTEGGDFKRAARQRMVLGQMIGQYNTLGSSDKINLILNNIENIEVGFMDDNTEDRYKRLADLINAVSNYERKESGFPYYKSGYDKDADLGAIVVPCDLITNVTKLHQTIYAESWYMPNKTVKNYSTALEKMTGLGYNNRYEGLDDI